MSPPSPIGENFLKMASIMRSSMRAASGVVDRATASWTREKATLEPMRLSVLNCETQCCWLAAIGGPDQAPAVDLRGAGIAMAACRCWAFWIAAATGWAGTAGGTGGRPTRRAAAGPGAAKTGAGAAGSAVTAVGITGAGTTRAEAAGAGTARAGGAAPGRSCGQTARRSLMMQAPLDSPPTAAPWRGAERPKMRPTGAGAATELRSVAWSATKASLSAGLLKSGGGPASRIARPETPGAFGAAWAQQRAKASLMRPGVKLLAAPRGTVPIWPIAAVTSVVKPV